MIDTSLIPDCDSAKSFVRDSETPQVGQPFNPFKTSICAPMPIGVMASKSLAPTAKLVYCHLRRRAGSNGECWPPRADIARAVDVTERRVSSALRELEAAGLIRTRIRGNSYGGKANVYEFLWHQMLAVDTVRPVEIVTPPTVEIVTPPSDKIDSLPLTKSTTQVGKESSSVEKGKEELGKAVLDPAPSAIPAPPPAERKTPSDKAPEVRSERSNNPEPSGIEFAFGSPKDELKSILSQATGEAVPSNTLQTILQNLELRQVPLDEFVRKTKPHLLRKSTINPVGLAITFSQQFGRLTMPSAPVVAAPVQPAPAAYVCPICKSSKPGEGSRFLAGQIVPCHCATPEYIAAKRHIFGALAAIPIDRAEHSAA